ncbi:DEAD-box ATP-dependent RNA helicase 5 [Camellia lanceoleosa]|uniref:DEAD-box ATP-dependent RNA helicase 5 n=1 Tax=Camellia lanceoleosa TaxID=1840588 RepID=A0ACC0FLS6_9ERIC|nr:DEAD-box ATP-dependent RNA helicase 5 [Camellia lanceoleosa]
MIHRLFKEVKQPVPQGVETMDWNSLKGIINAFLRQKRYVLVFDDVWDIQAWQVFRYTFPECNCGSRVMLTTRNADLALFSSREYNGYVYDLQPLSPQESWALFCKKTFQENYCPSHLEGLLTSILRRCEGLPLAIVAISGLLSVKDKSSVAEWEKTYQSLEALREAYQPNGNLDKNKEEYVFEYVGYSKDQVLDEGDWMLDMGFEPEVRSILSQTCSGIEYWSLFCTRRKARVETMLQKRGWKVVSIHGDKAQHARTKAISLFKEGSCPLMIATDVAARGLDIPDVEVVINYSFPLTTEDYIHRIGRTGQAESKLYEAHFKEIAANAPKATKITFDSSDDET